MCIGVCIGMCIDMCTGKDISHVHVEMDDSGFGSSWQLETIRVPAPHGLYSYGLDSYGAETIRVPGPHGLCSYGLDSCGAETIEVPGPHGLCSYGLDSYGAETIEVPGLYAAARLNTCPNACLSNTSAGMSECMFKPSLNTCRNTGADDEGWQATGRRIPRGISTCV